MPVYRNQKSIQFTPDNPVEKHFHDYDETWIITDGQAKAFMIDRNGQRSEFMLEKGDIWMIEAGVEHGCDPLGKGVLIFPFPGTIPEGSDQLGHCYMEKEHYMPTLYVKKTTIDRYRKEETDA